MGTVNNKIKKPFVSIGFDATGKLTFNVDLNKTNKLNQTQLLALGGIFENVISAINNGGGKEIDHKFNLFIKKSEITLPRTPNKAEISKIKELYS